VDALRVRVFARGSQHNPWVMWSLEDAQSFFQVHAGTHGLVPASARILPEAELMQDKSMGSSMDLKKTEQSSRLHMTQGLC